MYRGLQILRRFNGIGNVVYTGNTLSKSREVMVRMHFSHLQQFAMIPVCSLNLVLLKQLRNLEYVTGHFAIVVIFSTLEAFAPSCISSKLSVLNR